MSLKTWKAEFYPKPASRVSKKDALAHSLQKWEGLKNANLKKHGVESYGREITSADNNGLDIDEHSCALCKHYADLDCFGCPIYKVRGMRCDEDENGIGGDNSPYVLFTTRNNPLPMLRLLKAAQKAESK